MDERTRRMKIVVAGASGATGRWLVDLLLDRGHEVIAIVRSSDRLPENLRIHDRLSLIEASILDLTDAELARHVEGCTAVASCLGHNLTLKGLYGRPRRLVTEATRRLCEAVRANGAGEPTRFVLMNTTGNRNRDLDERLAFAERIVIGLLRLLLPPQADNEKAADYLRINVGQDDEALEWTAVRPDGLINEDQVTPYEVHPSPTRGVVFSAGKVSRINVAHFMARLATEDDTWNDWKGQMPVIYSAGSS